MQQITLKDFKKKIKGLPDDTILCMYSDSEGNEKSTCLDVFIDKVGYDHVDWYDGKRFHFIGGEDIIGIDQEKDKGRYLIILQPSL